MEKNSFKIISINRKKKLPENSVTVYKTEIFLNDTNKIVIKTLEKNPNYDSKKII